MIRQRARRCGVIVGLVWAMAVALMLSQIPQVVAQVVYSNDFEDPLDPLVEWSNRSTDVTPVGGRRFLGQFGNGTVTLSLFPVPAHTSVTVSFQLFIIRTWDGDGGPGGGGPDIWGLNASGGLTTLVHTTFGNIDGFQQAYPEAHPGGSQPTRTGADEVNTLGYTFNDNPLDTVYQLRFTFPHTETLLELFFFAAGLQSLDDESWGLDSIEVRVTSVSPSECDVNQDGQTTPVDALCCFREFLGTCGLLEGR